MLSENKRPVRTLIVDDEPLARNSLRMLLSEDPEVSLVGECSHGRMAIDSIRKLKPDLVFLDIQMPEKTGFDVVEAVGVHEMPVVVFVTAYDQFALKAFQAQALDYLLKPFDDERFFAVLSRAKSRIMQTRLSRLSEQLLGLVAHFRGASPEVVPPADATPPAHLTRLLVKSGGKTILLKVEDIDWIEASDYYSSLHVGPRTHLLRETMASLEKRLDPRQFLRIHRSAIVNLDRVARLQPLDHGEYQVVLQDGTELKLSRGQKEKLNTLLMVGR